MQQTLHMLMEIMQKLGIVINIEKTEAMKFGSEGRILPTNALCREGPQLNYVSRLPWLDHPIAGPLIYYLCDRKVKESTCGGVNNQQASPLLLLKRVLQRFDLNITPTASYSMRLILKNLQPRDSELVEGPYIKKSLWIA